MACSPAPGLGGLIDTTQTPLPPETPQVETTPLDDDAKERTRFREVQTKALGDKSIQALKDKVDHADNDDEYRNGRFQSEHDRYHRTG